MNNIKKLLSVILIVIIPMFAPSQNFSYDIKYHRLNLNLNPSQRYISGEVTTYFSPKKKNFNEISFDLSENLSVDSITYHNQELTYSHNNDTLTICLPKNLNKNDLDSICVFYQGAPKNEGFGSFNTTTHNDIPVMWTLSEPYFAKNWWPCKIALNDKADSIDLFVSAPSEYKVAANGLLISEKKIKNNLKITHWKHKYPITAYLVAFAITNYSKYTDTIAINDSTDINMTNYVYPEDSSYAATKTPNLIDVFQFFCDTFMIYPFLNEKYGHAQFNWGGGMEHQTMTFVSNFSHDLMAHELAHQWFGNYITCGSWQDIWLNEGFAVYLEGLTAEQGLAPYTWENWKATTMDYATSENSGSVYIEPQDTNSVYSIFDYRLTYMKGGMILHLLRWTIGDKAFFNGIRNYLNDPDLAYSYAKVDDLKYHFEQTCNCDLTEFFNDWYYGQGFPYFDIRWWQNKDNQVFIEVIQTPSHNSIDFFELKLPFKIIGLNKDTTLTVENIYPEQTFMFNLDFNVTDLIFDPQQWILTRNPQITHIISKKENQKVKIAPNPTKNYIYVIFPAQSFIESYTVYSSLGNQIIHQSLKKRVKKIKIDAKKLKKGTYILHLNTSEQSIIEKFVK